MWFLPPLLHRKFWSRTVSCTRTTNKIVHGMSKETAKLIAGASDLIMAKAEGGPMGLTKPKDRVADEPRAAHSAPATAPGARIEKDREPEPETSTSSRAANKAASSASGTKQQPEEQGHTGHRPTKTGTGGTTHQSHVGRARR